MDEEEANASENSIRVSEGLDNGTDLVIQENDYNKSVKSDYGPVKIHFSGLSKLDEVKMHLSGL